MSGGDRVTQWYNTVEVDLHQPMWRLIPQPRVGKLALLTAMIDQLVGGSTITLIGDLRRCRDDLDAVHGVIWHEPETRVTLPLEPTTHDPNVRRILPRIGLAQHVQHMLIMKDASIGFQSEDWFLFREGFVKAGPAVSEVMLQTLIEQGIILGYEPVQTADE